MSDKYTLNVQNNSTQTGSFCIFQDSPDINLPGITTLAWMAKAAHPSTLLEFEWGIDYSFVWARAVDLKPGTVVKTSQSWEADLRIKNKVQFDYINGAYTFSNQTQSTHPSSLYINNSHRINSKEAAVGIGMSGKGTFLVPAEPNMNVIMTPKPQYWLTFGDYKEGEVLDISKITGKSIKLDYKGKNALNVELTSDNNWKVVSSF